MFPQNAIKKVDKYELTKVIGKGSFATVYQAVKDSKLYAIKEMDISKAAIEDGRMDLFQREVDILQKLNHENIVQLYERIEMNDFLYLVFDYCSQGDLEKYLRKNNQSKISEDKAKSIFIQIVAALIELKRLNIVHRDLKLANILMTDDSTIKLADFGFAKLVPQNELLESYCGTPLTMAPEIYKFFQINISKRNEKSYSEKCDMWSLGVILYQMLYGYAPFRPKAGGGIEELFKIIATTKLQFPPTVKISDGLKKLLENLLQVDPNQRYSIDQVIQHIWLKDDLDKLAKRYIEASADLQASQQQDIFFSVQQDSSQAIALIKKIRQNIYQLQQFTKEINDQLQKKSFYQNESLQKCVRKLEGNQYYLSIGGEKLYHRIKQNETTSLDYLLYELCLELYNQLINLPRNQQQECMLIVKCVCAYIIGSIGLRSSYIVIDQQEFININFKILEKIDWNDLNDLLPENNSLQQSVQTNSCDWLILQELIHDRDRLITQ